MAEKPVKKESALETIRDLLNQNKDAIIATMPRYASPDRIFRVAMTCLRRNPELLKCDPMSFVGALIEANQLGLSLDPNLGEAYLVPFGGKVQLIPGYKGYIHLAKRSGDVSMVEAQVVCEGDTFTYKYGTQPFLEHTPAAEKRGETLYAYCIITFRDGFKQFHVMNKEELAAIRARSKAKNSGPWQTDPDEMNRKTPVRNLLKYADLNPDLKRAIGLDQSYEAGIDQGQEFALAGIDNIGVLPATTKTVETLKDKAREGKEKPTPEPPFDRAAWYERTNALLREYEVSMVDWIMYIKAECDVEDRDALTPEQCAVLESTLKNSPAEVIGQMAQLRQPKEPLTLEQEA